MKNTLILFGRSLFIDKVKKYIPELIQKYDTMGINTFYESYPDIKYVIYKDKGAYPKKKIDNIIVTDIDNSLEVINQKNVELYEVITNRYEFSTSEKVLNFYYFTSNLALNWAYVKHYKNVVLCGIDLMNNLHFDDINHKPNVSQRIYSEAKKYMENLCQEYINLYQLNPESDLKIPKIDIETLLKGDN